MLTKNFPGRKDARRRKALERMKKIKEPSEGLLKTIEKTEAKLTDKPRGIKTKKARGKPSGR